MSMDVATPEGEAIIVMRRTFDAPRDVVWRAFTGPKHVAQWYGGHGFENVVHAMDVRPGGLWRHTMRPPGGAEYRMVFVFVEVVKPEKLVWKNFGHGEPQPTPHLNVVNTVTLEDAGKKTRWQLVARFDSVAERDHAMKSGFTRMIAQGSEKLEAIASELARAEVSR